MKPLKSALSAALEALQDAERRRGKVYASVWTNEWTGAKCLLAAALYSSGDAEAAQHHASELIERLGKTSADLHPAECDVMHGRAGALQAIWFLRTELQDPTFGSSFALATSQEIILEGIRTAKKNNDRLLLAWEWQGRTLLGAGHGVVGILHSILGHSEEELTVLEERIPRVKLAICHTIDALEAFCHPSGNLRAALTGNEEDTMIEWAHGSTGYCLLLIKAYKVFGDIRYLNVAKEKAEKVLWPRRSLRKSISLCRGLSGIGYVFLALAQVDSTMNHTMWRKRTLPDLYCDTPN
jgi:lantibiotic modifying enzyme